jgi:two-component system invasion response regulator UvrY
MKILSPRERQILNLMLAGHKPASISSQLKLSRKTISTFRRRILNKTETKTDCELGKWAATNLQ